MIKTSVMAMNTVLKNTTRRVRS